MYTRTLFEIAKIAKISMDIERQVTHIQELEKERRMARTDLKNEILYKQIDFCIQSCQDDDAKKQLDECLEEFVTVGGLSYGKMNFFYSYLANLLWENRNDKKIS